MAKIQVTGGSVVVTSDLSDTLVEKVFRANPNALTLLDEEKNPIFSVCSGKNGSVSNFGITFNGKDETGKLRLTFPIEDTTPAAKKEYLEQILLGPMLNLKKLTAQIEAAGAEIDTNTAEIFSGMTVK